MYSKVSVKMTCKIYFIVTSALSLNWTMSLMAATRAVFTLLPAPSVLQVTSRLSAVTRKPQTMLAATSLMNSFLVNMESPGLRTVTVLAKLS